MKEKKLPLIPILNKKREPIKYYVSVDTKIKSSTLVKEKKKIKY